MAISIHPHKGYLNSLFNIYVSGESKISYEVRAISDDTRVISQGFVSPNEPYKFKIPVPGEFIVTFSDGTSTPVKVEDGYKYGGGRFKRGYVFDYCPWVFVIMHDRTYFYNRDTQIGYVETISPDFIEEVSSDYVILGNKGQEERTLYSLHDQKPILWVSNIVYHNKEFLVWKETTETDTILIFYSLAEQRWLKKQKVDHYIIEEKSKRLLYSINNRVEAISLLKDCENDILLDHHKGDVVAIFAPSLAICYADGYSTNTLYIYNMESNQLIKEIELHGALAKVGQNKIINIGDRKKSMKELDLVISGVPDAELSAAYYEYNFFPTEWEVFYTEKIIQLKKYGSHTRVDREERCELHSCRKQRTFTLKDDLSSSVVVGDTICIHNNNECFVCNRSYSTGSYEENCSTYVQGSKVYLYKDSALFTLSRNGFWDHKREHDFDFSEFDRFGIVEDKKSLIYQTLGGFKVGKCEGVYNPNNELDFCEPRMRTKEYYIYSNDRRIKNNGSIPPMYISPKAQYGLTVNDEGVFLSVNNNGVFEGIQILCKIYDTSKYHNVLLSEDGDRIMHRDGASSIIMDLSTGCSEKFDNVSFIKHINGIRPLFDTPSSLQPRLINPVTKQPIDCKMMSEYQFTSPNGKLYADSRLSEYVEYYRLDTGKVVTKEEYQKLEASFQYPWQLSRHSKEWEGVTENRRSFILDNFNFLNERYPRLLNNDRTGKHWDKSLLDVGNQYGATGFLNYFIGRRGVAYIRRSCDDSEYAKIELGEPLTYINYVSFSYDNKFAALAGYRGYRGANSNGLFIIYDLDNKETILFHNTGRAVWLTAFSINNALASYASNPFTFFAKNKNEYKCERFEDRLIHNRSFLTFSPDGSMFALSEQGYVSKYDRYGVEQSGWGHQPSSLVELHATTNLDKVIAIFHDLSDTGIEDVATSKESVASVSFSNNNKRLMMVGRDGVVIVRNLNLEE